MFVIIKLELNLTPIFSSVLTSTSQNIYNDLFDSLISTTPP